MPTAQRPTRAPATSRSTAPRLLPIAGPLFVELVLGMAVGAVGTALAGRQGDIVGAAFGLAAQVLSLLFILFRIVGAGIAVVVAQALGAGHRPQADAVARATLAASSAVGLSTGLLALTCATPMLRLLNAPPAVLPQAALLLMALAPALLLDAWAAAAASVLRAHLRNRSVLGVVLLMHGLHLSLALLLMPTLGLPGFAVALFASRVVGVALLLGLWRRPLGIPVQASDFVVLRWQELRAVLRIGVPGAAENIAYRLAFLASIAAVGALGTEALATTAYVLQVNNIVLLAGLATGLSMEIVIAHLIGAGALHRANTLLRRALAAGLALSVLIAAAAALAGPWLMAAFTRDAAIAASGTVLLWWSVLLEPGRTFNLIVINALRAAGDARFPVLAGAASMALVLAGGSWLLAHTLGLGLVGVWIAYAADEWLRGLVMWARWQQLGWLPHARAAHRRLRQHSA